MKIIPLNDLDEDARVIALDKVMEIFFLCSSVKSFRDLRHRSDFYYKWCGGYVDNYPECFFLAMKNEEIVGYLSGSLDSKLALMHLDVPGAHVYEDLFNEFPAHLHINCHPDAQGLGVGRLLIEKFCAYVFTKGISGVHLVTSTDADNLGFYRKLDFVNNYPRLYKGMELLLLGRKKLP